MADPALSLASEAHAAGLIAAVRPVTGPSVAGVMARWFACREADPALAADAAPYLRRFCEAVMRDDRPAARAATHDLAMLIAGRNEPEPRKDLS